jgi:hypothetical protein
VARVNEAEVGFWPIEFEFIEFEFITPENAEES